MHAIAREFLRASEPNDHIHAATEQPVKHSHAAASNSSGLPPEELAIVSPDEMKRCVLAIVGRGIPKKERTTLQWIIDDEAAAIAVRQVDTASRRL